MTLAERLRALAEALPSGGAVTFTRTDLLALAEGGSDEPLVAHDMKVEEVAQEVGRAASTVRGWLGSGELQGYKIGGRDWRIPRRALREFLEGQGRAQATDPENVDIAAWRRLA